MQLIGVRQFLFVLAAGSCFGQIQFPTYPYIVPAVARAGGPVYVIPGVVTESSTISLQSVTGAICLGAGYCTNAAGIVTDSQGSTAAPGTTSYYISLQLDGSELEFNFGALLISIEGVGTRQVFPANTANGLNSTAPPASLMAAAPTFEALGFSTFSVENPRIRFLVADSSYSGNSGDFLLTVQTPALTLNTSAPTKKIMQVVGPCDWETWVPPSNADGSPAVCDPTAASGRPSQVLGMDLGFSFEDKDAKELIFLFGDTIGVEIPSGSALVPTPQKPSQFEGFMAHDAIAKTSLEPSTSSFDLKFLEMPGTSPGAGISNAPVFVLPGAQPDGTAVAMNGNDVPNSGIHLNGENYIIVITGANSTVSDSDQSRYSVLVDYVSNTSFVAGRTISTANVSTGGVLTEAGHFVIVVPYELPLDFARQIGLSEEGVLIYGNAQYRSESIYLSYIPASQFWSGVDAMGNNATRYFTGLDATGRPTWSTEELSAVPVVCDNPNAPTGSTGCPTPDPGTAGNVSVTYNKKLSLWLMTWDGGRQTAVSRSQPPTSGIYFSYAPAPWGPWSPPVLIYNSCLAHNYHQGFGDFIRFASNPAGCMPFLDPGITLTNPQGPAGPIIGTTNDSPFLGTTAAPASETAATREGGVYAPFQVERFTVINGDALSIYFNMSTWNPYTVLLMQSNFTIAPPE